MSGKTSAQCFDLLVEGVDEGLPIVDSGRAVHPEEFVALVHEVLDRKSVV